MSLHAPSSPERFGTPAVPAGFWALLCPIPGFVPRPAPPLPVPPLTMIVVGELIVQHKSPSCLSIPSFVLVLCWEDLPDLPVHLHVPISTIETLL